MVDHVHDSTQNTFYRGPNQIDLPQLEGFLAQLIKTQITPRISPNQISPDQISPAKLAQTQISLNPN